MNKKTKNINIQNYLPHREPMLMVDTVLEISKNETTTSFKIKEDNVFIENGLFSEFGLIENIAQTCSAITGQDLAQDTNNQFPILGVIGFITNIKKIRIFELPEVGKNIISKASLNSRFGEICNISCKTYDNEKLLIEGEITLFIKTI